MFSISAKFAAQGQASCDTQLQILTEKECGEGFTEENWDLFKRVFRLASSKLCLPTPAPNSEHMLQLFSHT